MSVFHTLFSYICVLECNDNKERKGDHRLEKFGEVTEEFECWERE